MAYKEGIIAKNYHVSGDYYLMRINGDYKGEPGQFYMVKLGGEFILARPLSIYNIGQSYIEFLYMIAGKGTRKMSQMREGDRIEILGPLGRGFKIEKDKKVALIGGGIGIAPLYFLARRLEDCDSYLGFRSLEDLKPELKISDRIRVTTEDGSYGDKGRVLDIFEDKYDLIYACGPKPMLKAIIDRDFKCDLEISLEEYMACGLGVCSSCSIDISGERKKVCLDGPVFRRAKSED